MDMTPGDSSSEENKEVGKYFLTNRFQETTRLTIIMREDETVKIIKRQDFIDTNDLDEDKFSILDENLQPGVEGMFTMVYDIGAFLKFEFDELMQKPDSPDARFIQHSFYAPSKYIVPPGGNKDEGDVVVQAKNTDCKRTLLGAYKEIFVDPINTQVHNWVNREFCYYGKMIKDWKTFAKEGHEDDMSGGEASKGVLHYSTDLEKKAEEMFKDKDEDHRKGVNSTTTGTLAAAGAAAVAATGAMVASRSKDERTKVIGNEDKKQELGEKHEAAKNMGTVEGSENDAKATIDQIKQEQVEKNRKLEEEKQKAMHEVLADRAKTVQQGAEEAVKGTRSFCHFKLGSGMDLLLPILYIIIGLYIANEAVQYAHKMKPSNYPSHVKKLAQTPKFWLHLYRIMALLFVFWAGSLFRNSVLLDIFADNAGPTGFEAGKVPEALHTSFDSNTAKSAAAMVAGGAAAAGAAAAIASSTASDDSRNSETVETDKSITTWGDYMYDTAHNKVKESDLTDEHKHEISEQQKIKRKFLSGFRDRTDEKEIARLQRIETLKKAAYNAGKHLYDLHVDDLLSEYPEPVECAVEETTHWDGKRFFIYENGPDGERTYLHRDGWKTIKNFDWRKVHRELDDGRVVSNFVPKVMNQGNCGSCYVIAYTTLLTTRYLVKYPYAKPDFDQWRDRYSVDQQLEDCEYNQGCNGGDPMLASRWLMEKPAVTQRCWEHIRYIKDEKKRNQMMETSEHCKHQLQTISYGYTSGAIGGCGLSHICEQLMQRELYYNGPLTVAMDFSHTEMQAGRGIRTVSDRFTWALPREHPEEKDNPTHFEWQRIEHALVLIAYGEDNHPKCRTRIHVSDYETKQCDNMKTPESCRSLNFCRWSGFPYWTIQNSWGPRWAEDGHSRYGPRGHDTLYIEYGTFIANVKKVEQKKVYVNHEGIAEMKAWEKLVK